MTVGDRALAGDPETVQQTGSTLHWRTVGTDTFNSLVSAVTSLGGQSDAAVSVERILTMIQASSAPANLVQQADQAWGADVSTFGSKMADIADRATQARSDLTSAREDLREARDWLNESDAYCLDVESEFIRHRVERTVTEATERVAAAKQRLAVLDEERQGADSSAASSILTHRQLYVSARNALPNPPTVSAGVSVSAIVPDGSTRTISAIDLAKLKDPASIGQVWQALTPDQRQQLIDDFPLLIGNLDGIALRDRNTANVITAKEHRSELEKQIKMFQLLEKESGVGQLFADKISGLKGEIKSLDAILGDRNGKYSKEEDASGQAFGEYRVFDGNQIETYQKGAVLVGFNPLRDSIITFQGALDQDTGNIPPWMTQVGVVVPGTNSNLAAFTGDLDRGKNLFSKSGTKSGYFTWHGAPMPEFDLPTHVVDPAQQGFSDTAAPRLVSFANSLDLPSGTALVPIAHSYGAAVLGAAERLGLKADRIVYVAPAGLGHEVTGIDDFPYTKDKPHFVLQARNDTIVGWNQGKSMFQLGHGDTNPLNTPGVTRLETGYLDTRDPDAGTIESPGGLDTHSTPFEADSTSVRNITGVVTGDPVSVYQPNDDAWGYRGRSFQRVDDPDSGAGKPEEKISSVDLSRVE